MLVLISVGYYHSGTRVDNSFHQWVCQPDSTRMNNDLQLCSLFVNVQEKTLNLRFVTVLCTTGFATACRVWGAGTGLMTHSLGTAIICFVRSIARARRYLVPTSNNQTDDPRDDSLTLDHGGRGPFQGRCSCFILSIFSFHTSQARSSLLLRRLHL